MPRFQRKHVLMVVAFGFGFGCGLSLVLGSVAHAGTPAPPASPDPGALAAPQGPDDASRLARLLPAAPPGWEAMHEAPEVTTDETLRAQGLRASAARHYGRARGPVSEVCTVEFWSFASVEEARQAQAALDRPLWWGRLAGSVLVLAHGIRLERQVGARAGMVPGCSELAETAEARLRASR